MRLRALDNNCVCFVLKEWLLLVLSKIVFYKIRYPGNKKTQFCKSGGSGYHRGITRELLILIIQLSGMSFVPIFKTGYIAGIQDRVLPSAWGPNITVVSPGHYSSFIRVIITGKHNKARVSLRLIILINNFISKLLFINSNFNFLITN